MEERMEVKYEGVDAVDRILKLRHNIQRILFYILFWFCKITTKYKCWKEG